MEIDDAGRSDNGAVRRYRTDAHGLLAWIDQIEREPGVASWIWRGHDDWRYDLVPAIYRAGPEWLDDLKASTCDVLQHDSGTKPGAAAVADATEVQLVTQFVARANELGHPATGATVGLTEARERALLDREAAGLEQRHVALAQHYGIPTSLLDWTENPLTAAFFAASGSSAEKVCVWAMNEHIVRASDGRLSVIRVPRSGNSNLVAQQGVFTQVQPERTEIDSEAGMVDVRALAESLPEERQPILLGFVLSRDDTWELRQRLSRKGVTSSTVFPGLAGVAAEVISHWRDEWDLGNWPHELP